MNIVLTGRRQLAQVTERQSGQTNLFWRGFAIKPEEHCNSQFYVLLVQIKTIIILKDWTSSISCKQNVFKKAHKFKGVTFLTVNLLK